MEKCIQNPSHIQFRVDTFAMKKDQGLKAMKPDEYGYYVGVPLAGLGFPTRNNTYYDVDSFAKCITSPTSGFNKRLSRLQLYGERGHPKIFGLPPDQQLARMLSIDENNHAVHYRSVYTDPNLLPNGGKLILGDVAPAGPGAQDVKENFENPCMNTAFSLRSISNNRQKGNISYRYMKNLVTFDWVGCGGYEEASKQYAAATEVYEEWSFELNENTLISNEISIENLKDTILNDILGTNQVLQVSQTKNVVIMDPYHKDRLLLQGLTKGRVRDYINSL